MDKQLALAILCSSARGIETLSSLYNETEADFYQTRQEFTKYGHTLLIDINNVYAHLLH